MRDAPDERFASRTSQGKSLRHPPSHVSAAAAFGSNARRKVESNFMDELSWFCRKRETLLINTFVGSISEQPEKDAPNA